MLDFDINYFGVSRESFSRGRIYKSESHKEFVLVVISVILVDCQLITFLVDNWVFVFAKHDIQILWQQTDQGKVD